MTSDRFESKRKEIVGKIPASYSSLAHMVVPSGFALLGLIVSICCMTQFAFWMPIAFLFFMFVLFGFEWFAHKNILHQRFPFIESIYEKHEMAHHIIFKDSDMAIRDKSELYYVLIPYLAFVLAFALIVFPLTLGLMLLSLDLALVYSATAFLFYLVYEWLHFAYHLPETHLVMRLPFMRSLRSHHELHHNTRYMRRYNFNVTFPVFDIIMKTKFKG